MRGDAMNCPDEQDLVAYADGELDAAARDPIEQHLATCAACSAFVVETQGLTSLGRASIARLPGSLAGPAMRGVRPAWPRVVFASLAAAAAVLIAALVAGRLVSGPTDRRVVQVGPTTLAATRTTQSAAQPVALPAPVVSNDELFAEWAAAARRRQATPVRLVPMDEVASFRPPDNRPVTADDLNPRG
jgi:anti-sigma factor RsiW